MQKIKTYLKNYFAKKKTFSIISDFLLFTLIILLIIPNTRKPVGGFLIRLKTYILPVQLKEDEGVKLKAKDYHWPLLSLDGQDLSLSNFNDKPLFINFWATWCPHCIAEMPSLNELEKDFGDEIHFLNVSNESPEIISKFIADKKYSLSTYSSQYAPPGPISSRSIPFAVFISKNGEILFSKKGAKNWNHKNVRDFFSDYLEK